MIREAGGRRRGRLTPTRAVVLGLAAALILGMLPATAIGSRQDDSDASGPVVGLGTSGEIAFAFVGRIERRESSVNLYGYLTHVAGLSADEIFTDPANPLAETARFTLFGTADPEPSVTLDTLEVATATGEISVYYNPGAGASFEAAEAFFSGTRIATGAIRLHNVLLGDPGSERTVELFAELELTDAVTVAFENGDEVQFGEPEAQLYVRGSGVEPPVDEGASRRTTTFAGHALVAVAPIEATPPPTEAPAPTATPEADGPDPTEPGDPDEDSTPAADVDCEGIETWLTGTLGRIARTRALVTSIVATLADEEAEPFAELDPAELRSAADELNQLADAQGAVAAPPETEDAHRLLVSSFQTFARGLNLLATAVANENESALDQARTLIDNADAALTEGSQPLSDLAAACGFRN